MKMPLNPDYKPSHKRMVSCVREDAAADLADAPSTDAGALMGKCRDAPIHSFDRRLLALAWIVGFSASYDDLVRPEPEMRRARRRTPF